MVALLLLTKEVASITVNRKVTPLVTWGHTKVANDVGENRNNPKSAV